jgi:hypothetical protein
MSYTPFGFRQYYGPKPATFLQGRPSGDDEVDREEPGYEEPEEISPIVAWADKVEDTLKNEVEDIRRNQERCMNLYLGKGHWDLSRRPDWKFSIRLNYAFRVVEQWSAMLTDNRPKCTFIADRLEHQDEADIATAAFDDWYERNNVQATIEDAVKLSRIEGKSYLRLVPNPFARGGKGDLEVMAVSDTQIWVNDTAINVRNADLLLYEYTESIGSVLARYPKLRGKLKPQDTAENDYPNSNNDRPMRGEPASQITGFVDLSVNPGQAGYQAQPTVGQQAYFGRTNPPRAFTSRGCKVRELWCKEPAVVTTVHPIRWDVTGKPAVTHRLMDFHDEQGNVEYQEPLQKCVVDGHILYELPMSAVMVMEAAQAFGGPVVTQIQDSFEVVRDEKQVQVYPYGRRIIVVERWCAQDGANPYAHGEWPFIEVDAYRNPRKFRGKGDIDEIAPALDALNRLASQIMDNAYLTGNPGWLLPLDAEVEDEAITNAPGFILRMNQMALRYGRRDTPPNMPSYMFQMLGWLKAEIKEMGGLTDIGPSGGKPKGQIAAETVSMMQESAGLPYRDAIKNVEHAIEQLGDQWKGLAGQFLDEPYWVRVERSSGDEDTKPFIGTALSAEMRLKSKAGSMLPQSPSARLNMMFQLMNTPYTDFQEIAATLAENGLLRSASDLYKRQVKRVGEYAKTQNPISLWESPGLGQSIGVGGGQKKKAQGNAGRTARRQATPRQGG